MRISRLTASGRQLVNDIYNTDDLFGESSFLSLPQHGEEAAALEEVKVKTWPIMVL